ncbi:peroxiredoxin [Candidatus Poribacteria bacterium]|nr:peroxiredoxin [Candidatus Poribacteria bacterium]
MEESKGMLLIGDKAPSFEASTSHGTINFPEDYKGKWVVLFSHPADYTPVCTTEFVAFAKRNDQFQELNTELVGLSIDQVFSHIKWVEWIKENLDVEVPFPIIADNTGSIAAKFGMLHAEASGSQTVRAVFVIDDEGIIRAIIYYPLNIGRNMDEIVRLVKALQTSDEAEVALPANWPNNELIGDHGIVPPATSEEDAKKRLEAAEAGEMECFDWWLCHKKIK